MSLSEERVRDLEEAIQSAAGAAFDDADRMALAHRLRAAETEGRRHRRFVGACVAASIALFAGAAVWLGTRANSAPSVQQPQTVSVSITVDAVVLRPGPQPLDITRWRAR